MKYTAFTSVMLVGSLMVLPACGDDESDADGGNTPEAVELEIQTWWGKEPASLAAMNAIKDLHEENNENVTVNIVSSESSEDMQDRVNARISAGSPPAAFQANLGGNAIGWGDSLAPLDTPWASDFESTLLDTLRLDGEIVGVPLALTRQNNIFYAKPVLDENNLEVPTTLEELKTLVTDLVALGYQHPWCLGDDGNWTTAHMLFEGVVPAVMGAQDDIAYWTGKSTYNDPKMVEALDLMLEWAPLFNPDIATLGMAAGYNLIFADVDAADRCVMTVMGDWGGADMAGTHTFGEDFVMTGFPGAGGDTLFVFGGDAFVRPRGAANPNQVEDLFATLASPAGQEAFAKEKGSVPASSSDDVDLSTLGAVTQANANDPATRVGGFKVVSTPGIDFGPLSEEARNMVESASNTDAILQWLQDNYESLKGN